MLDLLKKRRSVRKYDQKKVPQQEIETILKAALMSPSSHNSKPWEFIVVRDPDMLHRLSNSKTHGSKFLKDAVVGIVILVNPQKSDVWIEDAAIASLIIHLTAESLSLGSCWIQIRNRRYDDDYTSDQYIKNLLSVPDIYQVESIVAIGYPAVVKSPTDDTNLLFDRVHNEVFGNNYF